MKEIEGNDENKKRLKAMSDFRERLVSFGYTEEAVDKVMSHAEKKGLWANIHAERKRIKAASGERMRKPGEKGAPSAKDLKDSAKD